MPRSQTDAPSIKIEIDVSEVPELKPWAEKAQELLIEWHPKITSLLVDKDDDFTPPNQVTLYFKKQEKGIAHASGK